MFPFSIQGIPKMAAFPILQCGLFSRVLSLRIFLFVTNFEIRSLFMINNSKKRSYFSFLASSSQLASRQRNSSLQRMKNSPRETSDRNTRRVRSVGSEKILVHRRSTEKQNVCFKSGSAALDVCGHSMRQYLFG